MNDMNEQQFANRIRQALNHGISLDARIVARLRAAREMALEWRRVAAFGRRESALDLASVTTDGALVRFGGFSLRYILPTLLMIAGVIVVYSRQQEQRAADVEELDAQLLTDDLPIDAYLDRGFEAWLKKAANR